MTAQPRSLLVAAVVTLQILAAGVDDAPAASSCPALPNAESTFAGALSRLIDRATGQSDTLSSVGDPVRLLNSSQQQKMLDWLRVELVERRAAIDQVRETSEAEQKVEDLQRRIFTRDRMERDASVVRGRIYDRAVDGTILPSTRQGKSLGELIDEEMARDQPSLAAKYTEKYRTAILGAIQDNPSAVGEFAGALSAGDYSAVADQVAVWGAQGFGAIVSDALEELGHVNSKIVWDRAVKHADAANRIVRALAAGRTDEAWAVIGDEWKSEVKQRSREALAAAVNFAFDAGSGAATIGDLVPIPGAAQAVIAPGIAGLTPGDLYLKLLDAEEALIAWSDNFLRTQWTHGDGECVRRYNAAHERTGSIDVAYEEFDLCSAASRYSAMFEFFNQAREIGIDEKAAIKEFLEAQRRHLPGSGTPLEWIKARAARIAAMSKAIEGRIEPELTGVQQVLSNISKGIGGVMRNRLADMVRALLNETQWDRLADEIKQLERTLNETLAAIDNDLDRVRRYSGGIDRWCTAYDRQKPIARKALSDGIDLSVRASRLRDRMTGIDTSACQSPETTTRSDEDAVRAASLADAIRKDRADLRSAVEIVCAAPDIIRAAPDKAAGRSRLEAALASAREVQAIRARLNGISGQLARLGRDRAGESPQPGATAARERALSAIAAAKGELDVVAASYASLLERFKSAHDAMRDAQQRIDNITEPTDEIIQGIKDCLRPLAFAPVAERPRAILAELEQLRSRNIGCRGDVLASWNDRDLDPQSGGGVASSAPWRSRSLSISPTPDALRDQLAEIETKCQAPTGVSQSVGTTARADRADPDVIKAEAGNAGLRVERCVADALVGYQDAWGKHVDDQAQTDAAESALNACRFRDSRRLIDALPEGPRRTALVERWNRAYEGERRARDLVTEAVALRDQGERGKAIGLLHQARDLTSCDSTVAAIDKTIATIESRSAEAEAGRADAALNGCRFNDSRRLIDALPAGQRRAALVERWNRAYEGERRARDLVTEAVALRDQGERGKAVGLLHQARDLTSCDSTVAAIDKAIAGLGSKTAAASAEDRAAAATASCQRDHGSGYRAGVLRPDGRYACVPDQATANAKCDQLNKATGYEAINIKNDGSFGCRMGKIAADIWCRGQRGAGWHAQFNKDRSRVTCHPDRNARTAQCAAQFGAGWRAGDLRTDGTWICYGPRQQATTPRPQPGVTCPPGHIPAKSGGCLNIGGIMQGITSSARGLSNAVTDPLGRRR